MQLMATQRPATIAQFLHRPGLDAGDFARFQAVSRGQTWHVLVYGQFATRAAAAAKAKDLPASLHDIKPWIRSDGDVQAAIKVYRETAAP
jgi:DamX protein